MSNIIKIEVVYALPEQQVILPMSIPMGSCIRDAIVQARLFTSIPTDLPVGVFGIQKSLEHILQDGERVEIYRPLLVNPKDARIARVKRDRKEKLLQMARKKSGKN